MNRQILIATLALILLFSFSLAAVSQEKEDEEKKNAEDNSKWEGVIPVYTFKTGASDFFKFGPIIGRSYQGPSGTGAIDLKIKLKSLVGRVFISFVIENRIWGSPGMDGFALPRTSLNIHPFTGKYYFDF